MIQSSFKFLDLHKILPEGWQEEISCYEIFDSIPSDKETEVICTNCNKAKGKFLKQNQFAYRGERFFQYQCSSCNVWFSPEYDQSKTRNDDYAETFEVMDDRRTELRFSMLEGLQLQKGIRLLEIGCGLGGLLNRIKVSFPDLKVVGLDDSQKMVDCMLGQGLEAHQNSSTISGKFDRVIAHHVIEHFKHPEDFHKVLQEFCDPGAIIQITFPNRENWFIKRGLFPDLHLPMHRFYFSLDELNDFFEFKGYKILECSSNESQRFIPNLTQAIYNHLRADLSLFKRRYTKLCQWIESIPAEQIELIEKELTEKNLGSEGCLLITFPKD